MKGYIKIILSGVSLAVVSSCAGSVTQNANNANTNVVNGKTPPAVRAPAANAQPKRPDDKDERVAFAKGTTRKTIKALIDVSKRYIVTASRDQLLNVTVNTKKVSLNLAGGDADVSKTPDGLQAVLKKDGDYIIEVVNTGDDPVEVTITISIDLMGE